MPLTLSEVVGRGPETARIVRWFLGDGPALLLLTGAAGLGKTTLWSAATEDLAVRGFHVLRSLPTEAESRLSYSGLADLLGDDLGRISVTLPPPQARALAVALRLEDPGGLPADPMAVARGALAAIRAIEARSGRVLVAIDDLRWLDAPSLAAIIYLARRLGPGDDVRILATHRVGVPEPDGLDRAPAIERLDLGPISVGGIHRIIRRQTAISLPRPRLLEIHALTLGNPLHATELARAMAAGETTVGDTLAGLYEARIAALPRSSRDALVLVAASADRSTDRLGRAWAAWPGTDRASLADAIHPAVATDLVSHVGRYTRPVHPVVTHVAYEIADPAVRLTAHRALADTASDSEERALHLGRAVDAPDAAIADDLESVARGVRARGVRSLSATLFERSAMLTPPSTTDLADRRWLDAAAAWYDAGDTDRVGRILEPLIAGASSGRARAEARWRLGTALDEAGRWPEATALWQAALEDTDDPSLRSQVQSSLAITAVYTDTVSAAVAWALAGVEDAERADDPAALARSLAVAAWIVTMAGRTDGATLMDRALTIEATIDEHLGEWSPTSLAAECARHTGDIPGALRYYAAVLDGATTRGDANIEQWAAYGLASAAILAGEVARASELADLVLDIGEQTDVMRIPARSLRAHVDAYRGEFTAARATLGEAVAMARAADEPTHLFGTYLVLGAIERCAGDLRASAEAYAEARSLADRLGLAHASVLRGILLEVEVAAAGGQASQAEAALAAFDERVSAAPPRWSVPLRRRAGAARSAAAGDHGAAIEALTAAAEDESALPPDVGFALLALAASRRHERQFRLAREAAETAHALFTELGMPPLAAAAERELARLPGRRGASDGELTPAEARVAALVAAGRTNREVAAELVLSVKTIEVTLTRVYDKLGIGSRSELAARHADLAREAKV